MPLRSTPQSRRTGLVLGTALLITVLGATLNLRAQQPDTGSSSTSSSNELAAVTPPLPVSELPDSPGALLYPQSGQTPTPASQTQTPTPAPQTTDNPDAVSPNGNHQTKRALGIIPNFNSVSADVKLPPLSAKDKFILAGKSSLDYSSLIVVSVQAGFAMNSDSYPEFHQGVKGYARYYWHTLADTTDENFFVTGVGPIIFHQDPRFYTLGHGGFRKRPWYAVTRVLVTRRGRWE